MVSNCDGLIISVLEYLKHKLHVFLNHKWIDYPSSIFKRFWYFLKKVKEVSMPKSKLCWSPLTYNYDFFSLTFNLLWCFWKVINDLYVVKFNFCSLASFCLTCQRHFTLLIILFFLRTSSFLGFQDTTFSRFSFHPTGCCFCLSISHYPSFSYLLILENPTIS